MITPVARRHAVSGDPPPGWLLTALVGDGCAVLPDLDTHNPRTVATARDFASETLSAWGVGELLYDAQLVVSELVTNAIRYAGGTIQLRLMRNESHLVCAVTDGSAALPTISDGDFLSESGRGLHLVDALASSWGWILINGKGKLVWAVFTL